VTAANVPIATQALLLSVLLYSLCLVVWLSLLRCSGNLSAWACTSPECKTGMVRIGMKRSKYDIVMSSDPVGSFLGSEYPGVFAAGERCQYRWITETGR